MAQPVELLDYVVKDTQEGAPTEIIAEDILSPATVRGEVVQLTCKLDPNGRDMVTKA